MNRFLVFVYLIIVFSFTSRRPEIPVFVSPQADKAEQKAAGMLTEYLAVLYPDFSFPVTHSLTDAKRSIVLSSDKNLAGSLGIEYSSAGVAESFSVSHFTRKDKIFGVIYGADPKGVLNGVYALLEELGYGFYLSFERTPPAQKEFDFAKWSLSDSPNVGERIVFNWHNFLSGCSVWDFPEWKKWIDQSAKMRYNTIMVHAYGNNPMFTYSFNNKQKKTSRLPATQGGRDYGTQQVNDVRRLQGGSVFDKAVFGAEVSQLEGDRHIEAVQNLMKKVFSYAEEQGIKTCFAFDVDTYSANPQALINTLPQEARFCIPLKKDNYLGRFTESMCIANPETPDGYAFYKAQIASLLELYPQIDQIAIWMRYSGSELLSLSLEQLPQKWQSEYNKILIQNPEYSKWEDAPGRFAIGKIIEAFQRALKDIGREDIELKAGSWAFDWMNPGDVFFPQKVGFIGLDYDVLKDTSDLDLPEVQKKIAKISQKRPVTPIFWAHHDDGTYIGRPYVPVTDLQKKLERIGSNSFGIIHWTTWPLDPYFKNMALQGWGNSKNQDYKVTIDRMAMDLFGSEQQEITSSYLYEWATSAPMMGRETREWFIDREITDQQTKRVVEGCNHRLNLLSSVNERALNATGKQYLQYFKGLERFSAELYRTENAYQQSLKYKTKGAMKEAIDAIQLCKPEQLIAQYAQFSAEKGITKGEKGIIIKMNLGWIPFIENQRQALGLSPIRYNFASTVHPKFGQGLLRTNYFMDKAQNLWRNYGYEETGAAVYNLNSRIKLSIANSIPGEYSEIYFSGIESDTPLTLEIKPGIADINITGQTNKQTARKIRPGNYRLQLLFADAFTDEPGKRVMKLTIYDHLNQPAVITEQIDIVQQAGGKNKCLLKTYDIPVSHNGEVIIKLEPVKGKVLICGAVLQFLNGSNGGIKN